MTNATRGKIINSIATLMCVCAPLVATLSQFPVWVEKGDDATMSGMFLFCACLCCIPFFRQIKEYFRSPSAWIVWLIFFVLFVCLRNIVDQMILVCGVGFIANGIGTALFKIGNYLKSKPDDNIYIEEAEVENGTDR